MPLLPAFGFSSYLRPILVLSLISLGFLLSWTFLVDSTSSAGEEEWMPKSNFRVPSYLCKTIPSLCNSPPVASSAAILLARPSPSPAQFGISRASYSASSTSRLFSSSAPFPTLMTPLSTSNMSSSYDGSTGSHMGDTFLSLKEMFLADLKAGSAEGWTLVMGNEAGDLDSLSSSIAYAYLTRLLSPSSSSTTINPQKTLPLILSPLSSLALRPENILALQSALLLPKSTTASSLTSSSPPYTSFPLLCTDELPIPTDQLAAKGVSFALVDHNRLLTQFVPKVTAEEEEGDPSKGPVVAILDHHEDEGLYISSSPPCDPRIVDRNAGSASSLVTNHFASFLSSSGIPPPTSPHFPIPKELATLLISSVLIDTGGLKPNGKAHPLDHQAISFLYPISTFAHPTPSSPSSISPDEEQALTASYTQGDAIPSPLTELASTLLTVKKDVSHLPTASLLARDYKQYTFLSPLSPSSSSTSNDNGNAPRPIHLGLATVPLGLSDWLARPTQNGEEAWSAFRKELETFCSTHGLEVLGVLTTYRSSKDKHRREILLYMPSRSSSSSSSSAASPSVYNALLSGLSSHPDLSCQDWKDGSNVLPEGGAEVVWGKGAKGQIWRQGNADATRKVVAPAFKAILEGGEEEKEVGRGRGGAFR